MPEQSIGDRVYEGVNALIEGGAMSKSAAIKQVAKELDMQPGTASANYYRIARKHGEGRISRPREGAPTVGSLDHDEARRFFGQMLAQMNKLEKENDRLRGQLARFEQVKELMRG